VSEVFPDPPLGVHAEASGHAQQAVLGQGVQNNYWYGSPGPAPRPGGVPRVVDTLVPPPLVMVGRADELGQLRAAARSSGQPVLISAMHGMGGAGKTALARALAAELAEEYPDARIEVDLYGFTPDMRPREPGEVLGELLGLVGFAAADVPAKAEGRSQLWRAWLSERRVLLVLDNARDATQVLPLLPGRGASDHSLVLVTSRNRLEELDAAATIGVDMLPVEDAVALLVRVGRLTPAKMSSTSAELAALARSCGLLPLALRSVGSLLAHLDPAELIEVMRSAEYPFQYLARADQAVAAAFTVSYDALTVELQDTLRACAWHPGPNFDAVSIAALTGRPRPLVTVQLVELLQGNMLTGLPHRRYTFHDLLLGNTRRRADAHDAQETVHEARHRLYARLQARLAAATSLVYPDNQYATTPQHGHSDFTDRDQARAWLVAAADELATSAHAALTENWQEATDLARTLAYWLYAGGRADQSSSLHQTLHATARAAGNKRGEADALKGMGDIAYAGGESQQAHDLYQQAHEIYQEIGNRRGQADALKGMGDVARLRAEHQHAYHAYRQTHDLCQQIGNRRGQVDALNALGDVADLRGQSPQAHDAYQQAHDLAQEIGYRSGQADALTGLAAVAQGRGEHLPAHDAYQQAHEIYQQIGNLHGLAYALKGLGDVGRLRGEYRQSRQVYRQAHDLYQQIGFRNRQADVLTGLGDIALAGDERQQAQDHYRQAHDISTQTGYRVGQADALRGLGDLALARGERQQAQDHYRQAHDIYHQIENRNGQAVTILGLKRAADGQETAS
jgi:tetratricopeptide (TPR) repeat protein